MKATYISSGLLMPAAPPAKPAKAPREAKAEEAELCCCWGGMITVFAV